MASSSIEFEMPDETLRHLCESYTREAGVRNFERQIGAVCRKVALGLEEGKLTGAQ